MNKSQLIAPVVKWAGGKRQSLKEILKYIPAKITTYYEPFLGGGALFLKLQPERAIVNDLSAELMNLYYVLKNNLEELLEDLHKHRNEEEYFYQIREMDRDQGVYANLTAIEKASRTIFLNKTCYNGLFRVNRAGEFNAPFGKYRNPKIVDESKLRAVSEYLKQAEITFLCTDFAEAIKDATVGSFVYLDPPYHPVSKSANFTSYDRGGFNQAEQQRLKLVCDQLHEKGVNFLLSNSATEFVLDLYHDYQIEMIKAKRRMNSDPNKRGAVEEILVRNYVEMHGNTFLNLGMM